MQATQEYINGIFVAVQPYKDFFLKNLIIKTTYSDTSVRHWAEVMIVLELISDPPQKGKASPLRTRAAWKR
jgi:hypothetical protein